MNQGTKTCKHQGNKEEREHCITDLRIQGNKEARKTRIESCNQAFKESRNQRIKTSRNRMPDKVPDKARNREAKNLHIDMQCANIVVRACCWDNVFPCKDASTQ